MDDQKLRGILEAILFAHGKEISLERLSEIVEADKKQIRQVLEKLKEEYKLTGRGLQIREVAQGYQMTTIPEVGCYLEKMNKNVNTITLSAAALETLAIIAYKQPLTRAEIDHVRGVKSEKAVGTLLERGLIKELGRKETIGKPIIYGTTTLFLQHFGLKNLEQLPALEEGQLTLKGITDSNL